MNLKDFVLKSTNDIDEAVHGSASIIGIRGIIHFDVAVVANENLEAGGDVQVVGIAKGNIDTSISNQTITRLQFDIQTRRAINPSQANPYNPPKH